MFGRWRARWLCLRRGVRNTYWRPSFPVWTDRVLSVRRAIDREPSVNGSPDGHPSCALLRAETASCGAAACGAPTVLQATGARPGSASEHLASDPVLSRGSWQPGLAPRRLRAVCAAHGPRGSRGRAWGVAAAAPRPRARPGHAALLRKGPAGTRSLCLGKPG